MRGVISAMLGVEGVKRAQERYGKGKVMTGSEVRWGLENLALDQKKLDALGFAGVMRPVSTSCADHMGSAWARIQTWDGSKWIFTSDWYQADDSIIKPMVKASANKYAQREEDRAPHAGGLPDLIGFADRAWHPPGRRVGSLPPRFAPLPPRGRAGPDGALPEAPRAALRGRRRKANLALDEPMSASITASPLNDVATTAATAPASSAPSILLDVNGIEVIYNHVILVLKGVSLQVPQGKVVALLGGNGAGKTTTLRAVSNLLRGERGEVTKGSIELRGERIERLSTSAMVERGVIQVMEGRHCFAHLTIEENLLTGAYTRRDGKAAVAATLDKVYRYFPRLKERRSSQAAYTSGGEQQMCAIGRALMANPTMVLLDEPSMGLAPQIVAEVFEIVRDLNQQEGVTFLLAEQNTNMALRYADYGYILESGRVVMDGEAALLRENEDVKEFYLGTGAASGERRSYREVKSYKRRKRWLS